MRVVDTGDLIIDELAGNVATQADRISIAHVKISAPTSEPWLTLDYDEWMCVLKGRMVLHYGDGQTLEVGAGQTVFIDKGERFRPVFPDGETEYIPVCLPAFRPDRCLREDGPDSAVAAKLQELHGGQAKASADDPEPEILYHMCQKALWEEAKRSGHAYFPPTFETDGFTHATAVPSRLIDTANHFYQDVPGEWVCLRFKRSALRRSGIITKDEEAMPVGDKVCGGGWGMVLVRRACCTCVPPPPPSQISMAYYCLEALCTDGGHLGISNPVALCSIFHISGGEHPNCE